MGVQLFYVGAPIRRVDEMKVLDVNIDDRDICFNDSGQG